MGRRAASLPSVSTPNHPVAPPRAGARWALLAGLVAAIILVPFVLAGASFETWAAVLVDALERRPVLVGVLIASLLAADVLLPVPSSIVSTAAGALLGFVPGMLVSLIGMTAGCVIGYWLGRTGGRSVAVSVVGVEQLKKLAAAAERHGSWILVTTRAVPVLAEASTIFAGMSAMRPYRFFSIVILASAGVSAGYAAVGAFAVDVGSFLMAFGGSILIPAVAMAVWPRLIGRRDGQTDKMTISGRS